MERDAMQTLWNETNRHLDSLEPMLRDLRLEGRRRLLGRSRSRLRWPELVLWFEVGIGVLAALLAGSYLAEVIAVPRFAVPAFVLHGFAILTLAVPIRQLVLLRGLDLGQPVVATQRALARLRRVRATWNRWLLLSSPLLWALLVVAVPNALLGIDVYREPGIAWVVSNFVLGGLVLGLAAWAGRRFEAWRTSRFLRALGDDLTGRRLAAVSQELDELEAFEAEGSRSGPR